MKLVHYSDLLSNLGTILPNEAVKTYMNTLFALVLKDFPPHKSMTFMFPSVAAFDYYTKTLDKVCSAKEIGPIINEHIELFNYNKKAIKDMIVKTLLP